MSAHMECPCGAIPATSPKLTKRGVGPDEGDDWHPADCPVGLAMARLERLERAIRSWIASDPVGHGSSPLAQALKS